MSVSLCFDTGRFHEDDQDCARCAYNDEVYRRARRDPQYLGLEVAQNQARRARDEAWNLPDQEQKKYERVWREADNAARARFYEACKMIREIMGTPPA